MNHSEEGLFSGIGGRILERQIIMEASTMIDARPGGSIRSCGIKRGGEMFGITVHVIDSEDPVMQTIILNKETFKRIANVAQFVTEVKEN